MKKTREKISTNKVTLVISTFIIAVLVIVFLILIFNNKSVTIEKFSFAETQDIIISFNNAEKENINSVLQSLYVEDANYFGFSSNSDVSVDLYIANSAVNLAKKIPNYELKPIKEKMSFLSSVNLDSLDFLNLTYFVELCKNLDIYIEYSIINSKLSKYYDEESNLFFIDSVEDSLNIKIIATSLVKRVLDDNLSTELFSLDKGIQEAYESYSFLTNNDITLFNSGGDILYCMAVFDITDAIDKSKLDNWYSYWKKVYESIIVDSDISALQYSEYLNIARIFESDYSAEKVENYYSNLTSESIEDSDDLYVWYNIVKNVGTLNNTEINTILKTKINEEFNSDSFVSSKIDIKSTAFGVMLAQKTDFSLNKEKLENYIKRNYSDNVLIENSYDRTSALYYNLILDQLVNGYDQDYDAYYFQSQIDNILKELEYSQSIAGDVVSTRRITEMVSDLQIFDVDIKLTESQKNKIEKGLKVALEDSSIKNSVLLNDIFIVDRILNLNIVSDEELLDIYISLTTNGGTYVSTSGVTYPDLCSTYQFMVSLNRMNNYDYLNKQKSFVETLKLDEGIYTLNTNSVDTFDLSVIIYGNAIRYLEIGGDKGD